MKFTDRFKFIWEVENTKPKKEWVDEVIPEADDEELDQIKENNPEQDNKDKETKVVEEIPEKKKPEPTKKLDDNLLFKHFAKLEEHVISHLDNRLQCDMWFYEHYKKNQSLKAIQKQNFIERKPILITNNSVTQLKNEYQQAKNQLLLKRSSKFLGQIKCVKTYPPVTKKYIY